MIFLRGYLLVVTQHLVIKMEFTGLNFPRGFRSSLGQRPHFICFLGFNQSLSFLSHLHQPSFESFAMLVYEAQPAILTPMRKKSAYLHNQTLKLTKLKQLTRAQLEMSPFQMSSAVGVGDMSSCLPDTLARLSTCRRHHVMSGSFFLCRMSCRY